MTLHWGLRASAKVGMPCGGLIARRKFSMNCPSCLNTLFADAEECPACGFSLAVAATRFGAVPRYGVHVTDTTYEELTNHDFNRIKARCESFEKKFPESRFSVFITRLLPGQSAREYAFYVFNRCQFTRMTDKLGKNFGLLLLINMTARETSLMAGYGLESMLSEEALEKILDAGTVKFRAGKLAAGALLCINQAESALMASAKIVTAKLEGVTI